MNAHVASSLKAPETRAKLHSWFERYGSSTELEIEARVREVDPAKFEQLLRKLNTNPNWSVKPTVIASTDILHQSGVRESRGGPEGTVFMRKQRVETFDIFGTDTHHPVRLQVSTEKPTSADQSSWSLVRHKKRHTFVHKNLFKFELTEVKQGPSWETAAEEDSEFEIEVEYCGQRKWEPKMVGYLCDSFIGKVLDAAMVAEESSAGHKRKRDDDVLACGDVVTLTPGTEVALEPVLGYKAHMPERLTAEESSTLQWVFSGFEKGPDKSEVAHLMSMPCRLGDEAYALFHFTGHVPKAAIVKKASHFDV